MQATVGKVHALWIRVLGVSTLAEWSPLLASKNSLLVKALLIAVALLYLRYLFQKNQTQNASSHPNG
jgi:hypothetical protein